MNGGSNRKADSAKQRNISAMKCIRSSRSAQSTAPDSRGLSRVGSIRSRSSRSSGRTISRSDGANPTPRSSPSWSWTAGPSRIDIRWRVRMRRTMRCFSATIASNATSSRERRPSIRAIDSRSRTSQAACGNNAAMSRSRTSRGSTTPASRAAAISGWSRTCSWKPISRSASRISWARIAGSASVRARW